MKPHIDGTEFGSITIDGVRLQHDAVIRLSGKAEARKKELSRAIYGTSHILSLVEARDLFETGAAQIIIGSGQQGVLTLSPEAAAFFEEMGAKVSLASTPQAIAAWNAASGPAIGLFHVTC
jgi:hypothetical protein